MLFGFDRSGNGRSTNTCIQIKQMLVLVAVMTQTPGFTALQSTGPQKFVLQTSNDNGSISLTTDNFNTSDEEDNNILDNLRNPPIEHSNSELDMPPNYSQTEEGSSALEQQIRASVKSQIRLEQNFDSSVIDALEDIADPEVRQTLAEDLVVFKYPRNANNRDMLNDEPPNEDFGYDGGETTTELTTELPETTTVIVEMEENSITDKPESILQNKNTEKEIYVEITEIVENIHSTTEEEPEEKTESTTLGIATNIRNSLDDSDSSESIEVEEENSSTPTEHETKSNSKVTDNSRSEEPELNTKSNAFATIEVTTAQMEINSRNSEESCESTTFAETKDSSSSEMKTTTPFLTTIEMTPIPPNEIDIRVQYTTELISKNTTDSIIEDKRDSIPSIEDNEITDPEQEDEPGTYHLTEERIKKIKSLEKKYELESSKYVSHHVQFSTVGPLEKTQNNLTYPEVGIANELSETTTPNKFETLQKEKLLASEKVPVASSISPEISRINITSSDTDIDSNSIHFRNYNNSESKSFELMIPAIDTAKVVITSPKDKGHHSSAVHRNGNSMNSLLNGHTDKELETFAKGTTTSLTNSALPDLAFLPKAAGRNFDENVAVETSIRGDPLATHSSETSKLNSNSQMIVVVALCSLTAFAFLAFSAMIFLKAFHRQHGTLDIEMQEQRCGKDDLDEEDAETRIKLLNPPTPPPPFDNDDE